MNANSQVKHYKDILEETVNNKPILLYYCLGLVFSVSFSWAASLDFIIWLV